ncbi:hypothetical protein [Luteolibacter sp. LG18]|uniref:hypothetical protein n=1 Tax=Luteolibacter sp. LG18 TaxID=2819286 RepID=UPI002B2A0EE9|nr:hypothetical protein llg_33860 [Luteolibacter sp. LG18]
MNPPPPPMPPHPYMMRDAEHLKLLTIFHYVMSGLSVIGILFGGLYAAMGLFMGRAFAKMPPAAPGSTHSGPPPQEFMWIFVAYGAVIGFVCLAAAVCYFFGARNLSARRNRTFCMVVAGLSCLAMPLGTVLGIFTIMVLSRETVARLFDGEQGLLAPS